MDDRWASGAAGADRGRPGAVSQRNSSSLISRQKQGNRITPSPLPDSLRSAGHPAAPNAAQSTVPPNNRLKSELYDSFLNEYYDLYDKKGAVPDDEANMDRYGPPAHQQFGGDYQRQGGGSSAPQQSHNNGNYDSHYAPAAPSSYAYDDAQQQQQTYHSPPYRDSPSPDMHPGIAPANNHYNQQYTPQPYQSPPRKAVLHPQQEDQYGPPVASSSSGFRGAQDQYQSYPQPENMERRAPGHGGYNSSAQDTRGVDPDYGNHNRSQSPYHNNNAQTTHASYSSADHLTAAAAAPAMTEPLHPYSNSPYSGGYGGGYDSPSRVPLNHPYQNPYDSHSISRNNLNGMDYIDPNALVDDGDDGLYYHTPKRRSMISLNRRSNGSSTALAAGAAAGAGAAGLAGAAAAAGRAGAHSRNMYTPDPLVHDPLEKEAPAAFHGIGVDDETKSRKWKKWLFLIIGILILGGIAAGLVIGLMNRNKSNSSNGGGSSGSSAPAGVDGPDMNINSPSVKALLNNKNLHKVFMGMAYTPMNTQYPGCLSLKPIQNNVTLDMAVLSQVTNTLRTYGTDCGQNELILHAISQLQLTDMKLWVGVWLDNNATTNTRQIQQLYNILDGNNTKYIKGVIIGNEVLYRQDLTLTQLEGFITDVRNNLTSRGIDLPVASADLGSNWSASLASAVDVVMSNVHPFFGGVPVAQAADWTWSFWQSNDVIITKGTNKTQIISEVGWPSQGGNDCAPALTCPDATSGAVSGISEMNTFMDTFVCQTIANGTDYFWFEAYDEPWKIQYDTPGQEWEDHWGLFTVNRQLKQGLTIPNCGGTTIPHS